MKKEPPQIGDIWRAEFSHRDIEHYLVLDNPDVSIYSTLELGSGVINDYRLIDWPNPIWIKVA